MGGAWSPLKGWKIPATCFEAGLAQAGVRPIWPSYPWLTPSRRQVKHEEQERLFSGVCGRGRRSQQQVLAELVVPSEEGRSALRFKFCDPILLILLATKCRFPSPIFQGWFSDDLPDNWELQDSF